MSSQLQVTLEPFSGGGSGSGVSLGSGSGFASASPMPHLQREQSLLNQLSGVQWNTPLPSPMDTSSSSADYPAASPSLAASPSGSGSGKSKDKSSSDKDKDKTDITSNAAAIAAIQSSVSKDPKYLENFLASLAQLPEFVQDKIGRIKGMEKAILMKSAALKEASAFHVQMIHLKLTPSKKDDSGTSSSSAGGAMSSPAFGAQQSQSGNAQRNASGSSPALYGSSGSGNNQSSGGGSNSNLPPLPHPSPLPLPLPYSLTPALVQPLPTENLLNNLTYLLVGPVLHANAMLHGHPSISGGSGSSASTAGDKNNNSSSSSSSSAPSSSSTAAASANTLSNLSRADLGILPMNLAPSALAPLGKKVATSAAAVAAAQHPFASIPSPQELLATSVTPILVDPPRAELANEMLDFRRRFPVPSEYSLESGEKTMRDHIACIHEWSKAKNALVTDLYEQVDQLLKRSDAALKKYENKLRRGHFEVPATPIDRRRGPGAPALLPTGAATTAAASSAATTAAGGSAGATAGSASAAAAGPADSRKRSHASLVQELEAREIQYQLQHELKSEIEKQSANALASANAGSATVGTVGAASMGNMLVEANEPVYCTCKKVSFGAMVACDNEDCPTEWFHFACVGLDTKPRGKWLCADCRKKKKAKTAASK